MEITKQRVIIMTMKTVLVLEFKKVAYELSGPFVKVGAPQAENDSSYPPENIRNNAFLTKSFH